ncbi:MAG: S49 family peptidase, partial [bacterium]
KHAGLRCVACIDVVAASGGYMMATVSDHIVAAPFAFIGSIGVVAGMPNFHRLLKKNEVDYHLLTAGKYKRTLTPFSEVQEEHREKLQADLEAIHEAFKNLVAEHRPQLDIEAVATGEVWLGSQALERGLVDELGTSDDYLMKKTEAGCEVILVSTEQPQSPLDKILQLPQAIQNRWSLPDSPESAFWGHSPHS